MNTKTMALALMTLAGTAMAQPAAFTDLGNRTTTQAFTQTVTTLGVNDIQWFRIVLPSVSATLGWVDIWTTPTANPTPATDMTDTEIALYADSGAGASTVWNDDDGGPGLWSQLTYGSTTSRGATVYTGQTNGNLRNGSGGPLAGGVYWLAVGRFNVNWTTPFGAASTATVNQSTTLLNFNINSPTDPYPPTGIGAGGAGLGSSLLTVVTTAGGNPASTGITVSGDLTSIGGSATQAFFDDGTHGDVTPGDGTFSFLAPLPASAVDGTAYTVPFTVRDAQNRSSTGSIAFNADVGQSIATANVPVGTGALNSLSGTMIANDVDMYKISICDFAAFSATTVGGTTADTRLFLFHPDGMGVTYNDDVPTGQPGAGTLQSLITGANVTANGDYYLAVTRYQIMASDASAANLWVTGTPFNVEIAPNGTGAANPLASWTGAAVTQTLATYTIALTGACYPSTGPVCGPADVGGQGGVQGADGHLDNNDFVVFIDLFFNHSPIADVGSQGGVAGADGAWDNNDFIVYIDQFFNAPASCR